jgi:gas vesicle protein
MIDLIKNEIKDHKNEIRNEVKDYKNEINNEIRVLKNQVGEINNNIKIIRENAIMALIYQGLWVNI